MANIKEHIKNLLFENKVEDALRYLKDWSMETRNSEIETSTIALSAQYKRYKTEKLLTLSTPEVELNKIIFGITTLINDIPDKDSIKIILPKNIINKRRSENEENKVIDWLSQKPVSFIEWFASSYVGIFIGAISFLGFIISFLSMGIGFSGSRASSSQSFTFVKQFIEVSSGIHFFSALVVVVVFYFRRNSSDVFMQKVDAWIKDQTKEKSKEHLNLNDTLFNNINRAENATKDFMAFWNLTWLGWLLLYVYFYCDSKGWVTYKPGLDIISSISSFTIIVCFSILYYKIKGNSKHYINPISVFSLVPLVVFVVLETFTPSSNPEIKLLLQILLGIFSGLSIALLVGRLSSIYIETPIIIIIILYIYSIIQALLCFFEFNMIDYFEEHEKDYIKDFMGISNFNDFQLIVKSFVLNFALGAKCLLSLIVLWLYENGGLYLYCIRINSALNKLEENDNIR